MMSVRKKSIFLGLGIVILVAVFSFLASESPDGLEKVACDKGFSDKEILPYVPVSLAPDYCLTGIKNRKLAKSLAGITGTLVVFFAAYGAAALLHKNKALK
jgi:cobalt/nickel transport protein